MTETNTPGGILGAILQIIVDEGSATPEQVQEMEDINKEWKDAGIKKGDWATRVDGKLVRVGSEDHRKAQQEYMNRFQPVNYKEP